MLLPFFPNINNVGVNLLIHIALFMFCFVPKLVFPQGLWIFTIIASFGTPLPLWGLGEQAIGIKVISAFTTNSDLESETQDKPMR